MGKKYIALFAVFLILGIMEPFAIAAQISGVNIPDANPSTKVHDITLEQAFDTGKLSRTVTVDGKSQKDVLVAGDGWGQYLP